MLKINLYGSKQMKVIFIKSFQIKNKIKRELNKVLK